MESHIKPIICSLYVFYIFKGVKENLLQVLNFTFYEYIIFK